MKARLKAALADRYRIERELGAGGMATVYLAADLKHDRKVAIKVLKPELAAVLGADRFVQEIKTTAALSHPHILPLFDSGTADGFLFYVMPYIEGETIREKLNRETQFGIDEAVRIATEVADALDYAHRHGVIHRDIKPENILLHDGRAMVMDFGIALAVSAAAGGRMTETGLSLGTPHYMSPEQATAEKEITGRSDVYSLASVLYEMLAGVPPHEGGSAQQTIMRIITETPKPVHELRRSVPPNVASAVARALEKLPADRFESARALAAALDDPRFAHGHSTGADRRDQPRWYRNAATIVPAVAAVGLAVALAASLMRDASPAGGDPSLIRFPLTADAGIRLVTATTRPFAVSPDGRSVVFRAHTDTTRPQLWVRRLDDASAHPIAGTEGGMNPAISPDGEWVAFVAEGRDIRKARLGGGDVLTIAAQAPLSAALSWLSDGEILLEVIGGAPMPMHRVSATGGTPVPAVPMDSAGGETRQRRPYVLRDAGVVVYASTSGDGGDVTLAAYRFADGRRMRLAIPGIGVLAFVDGRLIYSRADGTLMAVAFDPAGMRVAGPPIELSPRVASNGSIGTAVGLSPAGTLVYEASDASAETRLELVDLEGRVTPIRGSFAVVDPPRFSFDGRRLALVSGTRAAGDLWVLDVATGVATRLTSDGSVRFPSWFPDGRRLLFTTRRGRELRTVAVDGGVAPATLAGSRTAWSAEVFPNGKELLVVTSRDALLRASLIDDVPTDTLLTYDRDGGGRAPEFPRLSPDGRWVAFIDDFTAEVWVQSTEGRTLLQVSIGATNRGAAVWGPDSRHLYYVGLEGLVEIELRTAPTLAVLRRRVLPSVLSGVMLYDLSPDGKRFIVARTERKPDDVLVAVNWLAHARRTWEAAEAR